MDVVEDVMSAPARSVTPTTLLAEVRDLVHDDRIGIVPVLNDQGEVVGVLSVNDLAQDWPSELRASAVMTTDVSTVEPLTPLVEAARRMLELHVHHLVVTERDQLAGVISSFDVLRAFVDTADRT